VSQLAVGGPHLFRNETALAIRLGLVLWPRFGASLWGLALGPRFGQSHSEGATRMTSAPRRFHRFGRAALSIRRGGQASAQSLEALGVGPRHRAARAGEAQRDLVGERAGAGGIADD
jgi:hypothetical protein